MGSTKPFNPSSPTSKGLALSIAIKRLRKQKLNKVQEQFAREHADMIRAAMPEAEKKVESQQNRASKRKEGLQELKEGFKEFNKNSFEQLGDMAQGAISAFGLGDKKSMIKGALDNAKGGERFMNNIKAHGKMIKGAAKAIFNDLKWYGNYPEAIKEMIGPNFNRRMGIYEDLLDLNTDVTVKGSLYLAASVKIWLTHGDDGNGSVTASLQKLYTAIRQANSGSVNWTITDLDEYFINARLLIAVYNMGCRALRELNKYSIVNKGVPYANFNAMGLDYDTFAANAANLRNTLINLKTRLQCLAIPNLDLFQRTDWLFKGSFWDSNDNKHQSYYLCTPDTVPFISVNNTTGVRTPATVTILSTPTGTQTGIVYSSFISGLEILTRNFFAVDVYGTISGDIVKAYGTSGLFHLSPVPSVSDMPIEGYSEEVLTQIQNAYNPLLDSRLAASQQFSVTYAIPTSGIYVEKASASFATYNPISLKTMSATYINMYKDDISNLDVCAATRFTNLAIQDTSTSTTYNAYGYGTEIYGGITFHNYDYASTNRYNVNSKSVRSIQFAQITTGTLIEQNTANLSAWTQIDWAPRVIYGFQYYQTNSSVLYTGVGPTLWDFNNFAKIDTIDQLLDIQDVAVQSLYYTPLLVRNTNIVAY